MALSELESEISEMYKQVDDKQKANLDGLDTEGVSEFTSKSENSDEHILIKKRKSFLPPLIHSKTPFLVCSFC